MTNISRLRVLHRTFYNFTGPVTLGPHVLRLRPREGHDLRILSSRLEIEPAAVVRWHRDAENNCVGVATFVDTTQHLAIVSDVIVEQYAGSTVVDSSFAPGALFESDSGNASLMPYRQAVGPAGAVAAILPRSGRLAGGTHAIVSIGDLTELSERIRTTLRYTTRAESGVQSPAQTLALGSGSCRDLAALFMEAARHLGLAARFVSGYLRRDTASTDFGATHAWAEVYLPQCGWTGFDSTGSGGVGLDHVAVSVARDPGSVPPVAGTFSGAAHTSLEVGVWVTRLADGAGT